MKLLFLHQNFPAQFRHIAAHFAADAAHRVVAVGEADNLKRAVAGASLHPAIHPRIELCPYPAPQPSGKASHPWLQGYDAAVRRGLTTVGVAAQLKATGFRPDLIVAHPGWGEALFLRDVFPDARLVL